MAIDGEKNNPVADSEESDVMDRGAVRGMSAARSSGGANIFQMYKPNQGKKTRLGTGIGVGLVLVFGWDWLYSHMHTAQFAQGREWLPAAIALGICAVVALVAWYLVGVRAGSVDFLIATESEMKKVTWSSKKEVWGATKVVIGMVLLMSFGLFAVDLGFTWFFWLIGVLKAPFGGGGG